MESELFWVAVRVTATSTAVIKSPFAASEGMMRQAAVIIGDPGDPFMWVTPEDEEDTTGLGPGSYEVLIGYQTEAEREAGYAKLQKGSWAEATAEWRRMVAEEMYIFPPRRPRRDDHEPAPQPDLL